MFDNLNRHWRKEAKYFLNREIRRDYRWRKVYRMYEVRINLAMRDGDISEANRIGALRSAFEKCAREELGSTLRGIQLLRENGVPV